MGFLERAIRRGVSDAVGKAVGNAVRQAVEPKAADLANKAANAIDGAAQKNAEHAQRSSELEGAMASLERSAQSYATQAAKNMKICPDCNKPTSADKKFCPDCGAKLPEQTVAEGAVCQSCGKQNSVGTKFCSDCGTILPAALLEKEQREKKNMAVLAQWDEKLPQYPKWSCGGHEIFIEKYDVNCFTLNVCFNGDAQAAQNAVEQYRQILLDNGFRKAGQFPCIEQLYKRVDGIVYNADTEHCFEGDPDCACIVFSVREPSGGFDYVKPEPKKKIGFKDLFGL